MKSKHPLLIALTTIGWTVAAIVGVFVIVGLLIFGFFGDDSGQAWGFAFCFTFLAPLALVTAIVVAIRRFIKDRRAQKSRSPDEIANEAEA